MKKDKKKDKPANKTPELSKAKRHWMLISKRTTWTLKRIGQKTRNMVKRLLNS